jgi:hypothetical protein
MSPYRLALRSLILLAALLGVAAPAMADPKADILAAHEAMIAKGKFRQANESISGDQVTKSTSEVQWPNRFHVTTPDMEMVLVPGETYMKQGGQWSKLPMDMGAMVKQLTPDAMRQGYENMTHIKQLPDGEVEGDPVSVYEYDTTATIMGIKAESHVVLSVDKATGLVARQVTDGKAMGVSSKTVSTYTYDDTISITAPN